jgi:phosphoadenosine phosphosulfate reductase
MSVLTDTQKILEATRAKSESILVSYSGGKDSLVVMDLCLRTFKHVEGFFMALLPGIRCQEAEIERAAERLKIKIHIYPHWVMRKMIREGIYTTESFVYDDLPEWKLHDIYALVIQETGIPIFATGAKKADSAWRRRFMTTARKDMVINPIAAWLKYDVLAYLKAHGIPLPPSSGKASTGVDLSIPSLLWLHENYPADFERLSRIFPFAEAVVWHKKFYGIVA